MAAADDASSTTDWISLRDAFAALKLALSAYGSETLPEELLVQCIRTGKIPWDCELWETYPEWIAGWEEFNNREMKTRRLPVASPAWCKGDPEWFLRANLEINFQESKARDTAIGGAKASGIKLSHTHFLACLPEKLRKRGETPGPAKPVEQEKLELEPKAALLQEAPREREAPEQTTPAERKKMKPKAWLAEARKDHPQRPDEGMSDYADRLHPLMEANATKVLPVKTLLRRLYEAAKADRQVAQKAHRAPRTV